MKNKKAKENINTMKTRKKQSRGVGNLKTFLQPFLIQSWELSENLPHAITKCQNINYFRNKF